MSMIRFRSESGAVSLFVVIFAALLITIITVSFIRLMVQDQQEASTNDLSQSAYDSALAGVEDAKRALVRYRTICEAGDPAACSTLDALLRAAPQNCNTALADVVNVQPNTEVVIEQSSGDAALNQAYTCVKVSLETEDYLGTLPAYSSKIIPLFGTGSFTTIRLDWYSTDDLGGNVNVTLPSAVSADRPLLAQSDWPQTQPSIMRTQLVQFGSNGSGTPQFRLSDFDNTSSGQSNVNTLFLYPVGATGVATNTVDTWEFINRDVRRTGGGAPLGTTCTGVLNAGGYACSAYLQLPTPIGGGERTAYLRLTSLYNPTHYRVTLVGTRFDAVQPSVDSTGRANDLFRRVEARVDLIDTDFPFPEGAVQVTGDFCKDFTITDNVSGYQNNCP